MKIDHALKQLTAIIGGSVSAKTDWEAALWLAGEQLVLPQLFDRLQRVEFAKERVPHDVWIYLSEIHKRTCARNSRLYLTLDDALKVLNAVRIEPILLKGCALWAHCSAEPVAPQCDRLFSDLDLLVRPSELTRALGSLVDAGFKILQDNRHKTHVAVEFGRPSDVGAIDLHQHSPGPRGIREVDELHDHSRTVALSGNTAKLPPPELQIVILMLHDQFHDGHFWRGGLNIRHLLDVAALTEAPIDWPRITSMCHNPLIRAGLATYLRAAREIAGANVPVELCRGALPKFNFWRQKTQPSWPWVNAGFHRIGLTRNVWERFRLN